MSVWLSFLNSSNYHVLLKVFRVNQLDVVIKHYYGHWRENQGSQLNRNTIIYPFPSLHTLRAYMPHTLLFNTTRLPGCMISLFLCEILINLFPFVMLHVTLHVFWNVFAFVGCWQIIDKRSSMLCFEIQNTTGNSPSAEVYSKPVFNTVWVLVYHSSCIVSVVTTLNWYPQHFE